MNDYWRKLLHNDRQSSLNARDVTESTNHSAEGYAIEHRPAD